MTTLKQKLEQVQQDLQDKVATHFDILPMVREHIKELEPLMDQAMFWDLPSITFDTGFLGLKGIGYSLDYENNSLPFISHYEYDRVIYKYDGAMSTQKQIQLLAIIMTADCTNCCNALEYIRVTQNGLLAEGDVSNTYHS